MVPRTFARSVSATTAAINRTPRWILETVALLILVIAGWAALTGLDWVVREGLWGEWAFAMIGASLAIWLLARATARLARRILPQRYSFIAPRAWQAPIWAALPLVAVPFAALTRPWGIVLTVSLLAILLALLPRTKVTFPNMLQPVQWIAPFVAVAAATSFVWLNISIDKGVEASATPRVANALELAYHYRPLLFFDSREQFFPMNIETAIHDSRVEQCKYTLSNSCTEVTTAFQLDPSYDYLAIDDATPGRVKRTGGTDSTFYVHVLRHGGGVFLDYWIYYAENPEPVAKSILCGPGLRAPEIDCFQHEADWEGLTVELAACTLHTGITTSCHPQPSGPALRVIAVLYAEHNHVRRYNWDALQHLWTVSNLAENGERALAFVALNSHASYPTPCPPGCLNSDHYNGRLAWGNNNDGSCGRHCLELLPTTANGAPASWNAFPGHWGKQTCILLGAYCDRGPAPRAPAYQSRYKEPWASR
jgi:hypothetical protein